MILNDPARPGTTIELAAIHKELHLRSAGASDHLLGSPLGARAPARGPGGSARRQRRLLRFRVAELRHHRHGSAVYGFQPHPSSCPLDTSRSTPGRATPGDRGAETSPTEMVQLQGSSSSGTRTSTTCSSSGRAPTTGPARAPATPRLTRLGPPGSDFAGRQLLRHHLPDRLRGMSGQPPRRLRWQHYRHASHGDRRPRCARADTEHHRRLAVAARGNAGGLERVRDPALRGADLDDEHPCARRRPQGGAARALQLHEFACYCNFRRRIVAGTIVLVRSQIG